MAPIYIPMDGVVQDSATSEVREHMHVLSIRCTQLDGVYTAQRYCKSHREPLKQSRLSLTLFFFFYVDLGAQNSM